MILRILKANPIFQLILTILAAVGIWLWIGVLPSKTIDYKWNMLLLNDFWAWATQFHFFSALIGGIIVLVIAFTWNRFINSNSLLKQSTYFPALIFVVLASCRASLICFYPSLIGLFFLMLAIRRLAAGYKKDKALSEVFDAGLFIGIASLFYVPLFVFIIFLWIAILTIRSLIWREWVAALIGFAMPFGIMLAYHYIFYAPAPFWSSKLDIITSNYRKSWSFSWEEWVMLIAVAATVIASFWLFVNKMQDNVVKAQKIWALMLWFVFFALVSVAISPQRDARSLVILALPVSLIFSNYFLRAKSAIWPELLFLGVIVTIGLSLFF